MLSPDSKQGTKGTRGLSSEGVVAARRASEGSVAARRASEGRIMNTLRRAARVVADEGVAALLGRVGRKLLRRRPRHAAAAAPLAPQADPLTAPAPQADPLPARVAQEQAKYARLVSEFSR